MDIETLRDLFQHQKWADNQILAAIRSHPAAAADSNLRTRLHHIVGVQRGFLALILERPFDVAEEMKTPETLDSVVHRFEEAHTDAIALVERLDTAALSEPMQMPWVPDLSLQVGQGLLQAVMHTQHHRGQCAMRLRELGGSPPMVDYILWLKNRQTSVFAA